HAMAASRLHLIGHDVITGHRVVGQATIAGGVEQSRRAVTTEDAVRVNGRHTLATVQLVRISVGIAAAVEQHLFLHRVVQRLTRESATLRATEQLPRGITEAPDPDATRDVVDDALGLLTTPAGTAGVRHELVDLGEEAHRERAITLRSREIARRNGWCSDVFPDVRRGDMAAGEAADLRVGLTRGEIEVAVERGAEPVERTATGQSGFLRRRHARHREIRLQPRDALAVLLPEQHVENAAGDLLIEDHAVGPADTNGAAHTRLEPRSVV